MLNSTYGVYTNVQIKTEEIKRQSNVDTTNKKHKLMTNGMIIYKERKMDNHVVKISLKAIINEETSVTIDRKPSTGGSLCSTEGSDGRL